MNLRIVETKDGLHSLYVPELDEHYHSTHGALQEANHVFIEAGLKFCSDNTKQLNILEIGFGTGLNAFLTAIYAEKNDLKIKYTGLELYPVPTEMALKLNYCEVIGELGKETQFEKMHQGEWGVGNKINSNFELTKLQQSVFDFEAAPVFNLIYFDAFGFRAQEEMWGQEVFDKMYQCLKPGGTLVTYSSKGEVRRRMQQSGFKVEKLAGPAGKREMVRVFKLA